MDVRHVLIVGAITRLVGHSITQRLAEVFLPLLAGWSLLVSMWAFATEVQPLSKTSDVRIIVDISGSMKQNDPRNLRVPAVKLLIKLLPDGSQAGIWTYGQWVNMLVPLGEVNDQWRDNAIKKIEGIRSVGLRTNIGGALENAMWKLGPDTGLQQSIILLTDGIVDIAPATDPQQKQKNLNERRRILGEMALKFQQQGAEIHTIALSDASDIEMMQTLAARTGGTHFVAKQAEDLLRVFAKAYQEAVPTEQVPINKNRFNIDQGIREFTALIFRAPGSLPTALIEPNGNRLSEIKQNQNLSWYSEEQIDLVTVTNPLAGEWEIEADLDPDNRILIVSDLMLNVQNVPENIAPGDKIDLEAYLHENGNIVTHQTLLKFMSVELRVTQEGGRSGTKLISDPESPPSDGIFREGLYRLSEEGTYELKVTVDGKTFQREKTAYVTLRDPIQIEVHAQNIGTPEAFYTVKVIPYSSSIDTQASRVIAKVSGPESYSIIQAARKNEAGQWEVKVKPIKGSGSYDIALNIRGKNTDGSEFQQKPEGIPLSFPIPADFKPYILGEPATQEETIKDVQEELQPEEPAVTDTEEASLPEIKPIEALEQAEPEPEMPKPEAEVVEDPALEDAKALAEDTTAPEKPMEPEPREEPEEESSYLWVYILLALVLIGGAIGGYFLYRWLLNKDQPEEEQDDLDDDLDDFDELGGDLESDEKIALDSSEAHSPNTATDVDADADASLAAQSDQEGNDDNHDETFDEDFDLSATDDDETISLNSAAATDTDKTPSNTELERAESSDNDFDISAEEQASEKNSQQDDSVQDGVSGVKEQVLEEKNSPDLGQKQMDAPAIPSLDTDEDEEMPVEMEDPNLDDLPDTKDIDVEELMEELDQDLGDQVIEDLDDVDIESLVENNGDPMDDELDDINVEELMREMDKEEDAAKKD